MLRIFRYIIFLEILCKAVYAQNMPSLFFEKYKSDLTNQLITCIAEDSNQLIWVGTAEGLNRLDGYGIKQFYCDNDNAHTLPHNSIRCIYPKNKNEVYIGTSLGGAVMNNSNNSIIRFDSFKDKNYNQQSISGFLQTKEKLWFLGFDNYYSKSKTTTTFNFPASNKLPNYYANIYKDALQNIWAAQGNNVCRLNPTNLSVIENINLDIDDRNNTIAFVRLDNLLFITTKGKGVMVYDCVAKKITKKLLAKTNTYSPVLWHTNGEDWVVVGTDKGCVLINPNTFALQYTITPFAIRHLLVDANNGIWAGTNNGLYYHKSKSEFIKHITFTSNQLLKEVQVGMSSSTPNNYFVPLVYGNGVLAYNKKWQLQKYYNNLGKGLDSKFIGDVCYQNGFNWVAIRSGLMQCNTAMQAHTIYKPNVADAKQPEILKVRQLLILNDSELVAKSFAGIFIFNSKTKKFTKQFYANTSGSFPMLNDFIINIALGGDNCYLCTFKDVWCLNLSTNKIEKIVLTKNLKELSGVALSNAHLWISSQSGLVQYDIKSKKQILLTRKNGLSGENVLSMAMGAKNLLWVATSNGLTCINTTTKKINNIFEKDGLQNNYMIGGLGIGDSGEVISGGIGGFDVIDPKIIPSQIVRRATIVNDVVVNNASLKWQILNSQKHLQLQANQNSITLYFSVSQAQNNAAYFYRINNQEWVGISNGIITLNNLNSGTYTITVANTAADYKLNDSIVIIIKPVFYKAWWFITLMLLLLFSILYAIYRMRVKHIRNELALEKSYQQKLIESEMQTLRSQMNPHFLFNTLNSINSYIILNKTETASEYLTTFSKLMRSILDVSKQDYITLEKEMETLAMYLELESLRLENKFDYTITIAKNIDAQQLKVPSLILQPFVENAIWHGLHNKTSQGHIDIKVSTFEEQNLLIAIIDDGIGRQAASRLKQGQKSHKSYGIDITTNRLKLYNPENEVQIEDLFNKENEACGTAVTIKLKTHYED